MQKPDAARIQHMLDAARDILAFTKGKTERGFEKNRMLSFAVTHLIEILGEAASGLSEELIGAHPEVRWRDIIGMRNRLIHGYHDINLAIVWKTVKEDMPTLVEQLGKILREEQKEK